jgi:hypothetical protein
METEIEALRSLVRERDVEIASLKEKLERMQLMAIQISRLVNSPTPIGDIELVEDEE